MKVAVIGAGIAGLSAAWHLDKQHVNVHLIESAARLGGHTHTHELLAGEGTVLVDTGFIVFNDHNYPNFGQWLSDLGINAKLTNMSFAVRDDISRLEYGTTDLRAITCNAGQLLRPVYWRLWRDLLRFYDSLKQGEIPDVTLGQYLTDAGYGDGFVHSHIVPMCAALWSQPVQQSLALSLRHVVEFMRNHQLLQLSERPAWNVVEGGSSAYICAFEGQFRGTVSVSTAVTGVERRGAGVVVDFGDHFEPFDAVVLACHSDQALAILTDATNVERSVLDQISYQNNLVYLHSDVSFMPRNHRCWSSWNVVREHDGTHTITYWMNRLQGLTCEEQFFVTLNAPREPSALRWQGSYQHPHFNQASYAAQKRWVEVCQGQTFFAGAYWGSGFHEDGFVSGQRCAASIVSQVAADAA